MQISLLTASEEQLMQLFWKMNSFYMREVMEEHPDPKPHPNTVSTYLKILVEKHFLKTEKEGRIFKYSINISKDDYKKFLLENLLEKYFEKSGIRLITVLLEENWVAPNEISTLFRNAEDYITEAPKYEIAEEILKRKKNKKKDKTKSKKKKK